MRTEDFLKYIVEKQYFQHHSKVVLALSGGLDSMFLFQLLSTYQKELAIQLVVAHVNHKQRLVSDEEERQLKNLVSQKGIPFFSTSFSGTFTEASARVFRYDFFKEVMEKTGASALVTAHHADDQAETVLMRVIRGSRLSHLGSIKEKQAFGRGELIRPLLSFSKKDFPQIPHFEDMSNHEKTYFRNRVRKEYLPLLETENPQLKQALQDLGREARAYQQAIAELSQTVDVEDLTQLLSYSSETQAVLLEQYLEQFPDLVLSKNQFQELHHILQTKSNYCHTLKNGYQLEKNYQHFSISKISPQSDEFRKECVLEYQEQAEFSDYLFSFGVPLEGASVEKLLVSRETSLLLRRRKSGDTLQINGMTKKVRRLFIDRKIPIKKREKAIIIEQFGKIVSILGIVTSDLSKNTKNDIMNTVLYIEKIDR